MGAPQCEVPADDGSIGLTQRRQKTDTADAERLAFLFGLYQHTTRLLAIPVAKKTQKPTLQKFDKGD